MDDLWTALGLVLIIEGAIYTLFPDGARHALRRALELPAPSVRALGIAAAGAGLLVVWLARG